MQACFRVEQWWALATDALETLLLCARELGSVPEFGDCALQLMGGHMLNTPGDRGVLFRKFITALAAPTRLGPQFGAAAAAAAVPAAVLEGSGGGAGDAGVDAASSGGGDGDSVRTLTYTMDASRPVVRASVAFSRRLAIFGETARVRVTISSELPAPLAFDRVRVAFDDARYDWEGEGLHRAGAASLYGGRLGTSAVGSPSPGGGSRLGGPSAVDLSLIPGVDNEFEFTIALRPPPARGGRGGDEYTLRCTGVTLVVATSSLVIPDRDAAVPSSPSSGVGSTSPSAFGGALPGGRAVDEVEFTIPGAALRGAIVDEGMVAAAARQSLMRGAATSVAGSAASAAASSTLVTYASALTVTFPVSVAGLSIEHAAPGLTAGFHRVCVVLRSGGEPVHGGVLLLALRDASGLDATDDAVATLFWVRDARGGGGGHA